MSYRASNNYHHLPNEESQVHKQRTVVVVDEEPSHEIYSSLFEGSASQLSKQTTSAMLRTDNSDQATIDSSKNIIPMDTSNDSTRIDPLFQVYDNAFSSVECLPSSITIHSSNKGHQILTKMGWTEKDGGLGRRRQGRMTPIKSTLKNDKKGLGLSSSSSNEKAVCPSKSNKGLFGTKAMRRRCKREELERKKKREKQSRIMLRSDIPDDMEELYLKLC